ncbi:TPA: hypothetical protein DEW47_00215 [Patescibacteria group bacterium]|nr:MAG: hypothetical protein UT71_C0012G0014 [Parcubacteria group bacterium GW2011_GWF2_40_10]KKR46902.1 MAG: hypothetical protein UT83_C0016G0014 [Parcubacteria group bacterium GW2011_GWA2_40_143]KKR59666.1 MAG: hypothetical protein UT97_C0014G0016 [Parcubacteria group bacterium GW2011_GWC2_40_31]KKR75176.1 MAG: hypothetical protein UU18_C0012G0017 [Parcubacteria group bacterium GW2011_GWB2_40_8]KKR83298.1 MAG: hypothetical protein UU28_C0002G0012 [Parcubacteria group bacterium GW2011_GWD2_40_
MSKTKIILIGILTVAFLLRLLGITYGLPLWVIPDEQGSIFGALKMMELRSLIPANHIGEFLNVLYYPPFISYLYIIPFSILLGLKFLFTGLPISELKDLVMLDLSWFFILARLFSTILGTATVWLVYKISKNIFGKEVPALLSAGFLSVALLHISFSHWARHWVWTTFLLTLIIFFLSKKYFSLKKKYLLSSLFAGIGMGINYQVGLSAFFMFFWLFFYDKLRFRKILKERWPYEAIGIFLGLFALTIYVYPATTGARDLFADGKISFLGGFVFYFQNLLMAEPAFLFFTILGFIFSFFYYRKYFLTSSFFVLSYITIFDIIYLHNGRYIIMLYPIFAIMSGYGAYKLWEIAPAKFKRYVLFVTVFAFIFMVANTIRFNYLLIKNDTRIQSLKWVNINIPEGSKVAVLVPLTRLPSLPKAIDEQKSIDAFSLRKIDYAELNIRQNLRKEKKFHALNLYTIRESWFPEKMSQYIKDEKYEYLIISPSLANKKKVSPEIYEIGREIKTFYGFDDEKKDMVEDNGGGLKNIYNLKNSGPTIIIRKLY